MNYYIKKKFLICLVTTCCIFITFGQNVTGKVVGDSDKKPLFNATVQLLNDKGKTLSYVVTDAEGKFTLEYNGTLTKISIKVSYFGYEPFQKELQKPFPQDLLILLKEKFNTLNEIVVKSDFKEFRVKKDTVSYNLKALRDSTEVNLEDLVKKLPGLEINENGKIEYKNKEIDKVLIDGNEFFGNKHQIATKNIPASAVEGVNLLTNHQNFESVKGFNNKGKIVLNVKLKEDFKNKVVGNIEGNYGEVDKYLGHLNLFKFFKNGNISLVSDYNNIGETAITVDDYIELRGGINTFSDDADNSVVIIDDADIPSYVLANNLVEKREVAFNSLNYTQTFSERLKFVGYFILNDSRLLENRFTEKSFFDTTQTNLKESIRNQSDNFLSSSYANLTYKPNEKTSLKYQFNFNTTDDEREEDVINTDVNFNSFDNRIDNSSFTIGNTLELQRKIAPKWLLSSVLFQNHSDTDNRLRLRSDNDFLGLNFSSSDFSLLQIKSILDNNLSWKTTFNNEKSKQQSYQISAGIFHQNTLFDSHIQEFNGFDNNIKRSITSVKTDFKGSTKTNKNISLSYGFKNQLYQTNQDNAKSSIFRVLPSFSINYSFLEGQQLIFDYGRSVEFIAVQDLIVNQFVENFRKVIGFSNLELDSPIDIDKYTLNYFNINPQKNLILTSSFSYQVEKNAVGYNISYDQAFINENSIRIPRREHYFGILSLTKRFKKTPFKLKGTVFYDLTKAENSVENVRNKTTIEQLFVKLEFQSAFKGKAFQFNLGMDYKDTNFSQEVNNLSSQLNNINPYIEVRGITENRFSWKLETHYERQRTNQESNRFYVLNPNLQYSFKNDKVQIHIKGYNVLNLRDNELLSQSLNDAYFQTSRVELLRGYIMLGFRHNF